MLAKEMTTKTLSWVELENKTLVKWDGRGMKISCVANMELKFGIHIITHKIYSSSRLKSVTCEALGLAFKVVKNMSFDLAELMLNQFKKPWKALKHWRIILVSLDHFKTYLFFFVQNFFPSKTTVVWRKDVPILYQINEYITEMGENYVSIMDNYFNSFKKNMNNRFKISKKLVEDYNDYISFMVDCDKVYI